MICGFSSGYPAVDVANSLLRLLLAMWTIGYLVVSCAPLLTGNVIAGGLGLIAGLALPTRSSGLEPGPP